MKLKRLLPWGLPALLLASAAFAEEAAPLTADTVQTNLNYVWTLVAAFLVFFMQAGLRHGRGRLHPGQERLQHPDEELHGLRHGRHRVLLRRLRHHVRRFRHRLVRSLGLHAQRLRRRGRPVGLCVLHVPGGLRRHRRHHRLGRRGRADEVQLLPDLQRAHHRHRLPGVRELGLGQPLQGRRAGSKASASSTSPAPPWCTRWAAGPPWPAPSWSAPASASTRTASPPPFRATPSPWRPSAC